MKRLTRSALCTIAVCCVAAVAAGCGGDGGRPAAAAGASGSATSSTDAPLYTIPQSLLSAASTDSGGGDSTTTTSVPWDQEHVVAMPSWFTVTVDKQCVHPEETLGFTVQGGQPNQLLIYDTFYADGTDDYTTHYGTGSGQAKFDEQGNYSTSFVLAGKVPPGTAYLQVASAKGQLIQARTSFLIKPLTESCP